MDKPFTRSNSNSSSKSVASLASIQSHLSAASSQQRLRNHFVSPEKIEKIVSASVDDLENNTDLPEDAPVHGTLARIWALVSRTRSRYPWLAFCVLVYCTLSAVVFASTVARFSTHNRVTMQYTPVQATQSASLLKDVPIDHFLTKLFSIHPQPKALLPHASKSSVDSNHGTTACLWTKDTELERLPSWVSRWIGPLSVVVTTLSGPESHDWKILSRSLTKLQNSLSSNQTMSVHLLQVDGGAPENPNAYLNLARLLSPTSQIVLFPGNLSVIPPKTFYRSFFSTASPSARNITSKPTIFTTRSQSSFPFSPFSPIMLHRDDPLWCTERSFLYVSREADWNDCLWQLWLEHFGEIDVKQTSDWVRPFVPEPEMSLLPAKLRRRLGGKFRSETCMLATRRLAALRSPQSGGKDAKKARWLKRQCREWMTLA